MHKHDIFQWRPTLTAVFLGGALVSLAVAVGVYVFLDNKPTEQVNLGSGVFRLWVADTQESRIKGLSGVSELRNDGGLLMEFGSDDLWGIWMNKMELPIDIIWLNSEGEVVHIIEDAQPENPAKTIYEPKKPSRYVIELKAGAVDNAGIKLGQKAEFVTRNEKAK